MRPKNGPKNVARRSENGAPNNELWPRSAAARQPSQLTPAYNKALAKRQRLVECSSALGAVMLGALVVQFWPSGDDLEGRWESDDALLQEVCSQAGFPECQSRAPGSAHRCSVPQLNLNADVVVPANAFHVGPLLLGSNMTQGWSAFRVWQRAAMLRRYGKVSVKAGYPLDIAQQGSQASTFSLDLNALLARWRGGDRNLLLFQSDDAENKGDCHSLGCVLQPSVRDGAVHEFTVPAALKPMDRLIASLGPSEQGLPLHSHGGAWQALVHGRKLWVLVPAGPLADRDLLSKSARELLAPPLVGKLKAAKAYICLQEPGEVMVVPHLWLHATVNIGEAVAIGGQVRGEFLDALLECLEPLVKEQRVKSYEEGFAECERRWKERARDEL